MSPKDRQTQLLRLDVVSNDFHPLRFVLTQGTTEVLPRQRGVTFTSLRSVPSTERHIPSIRWRSQRVFQSCMNWYYIKVLEIVPTVGPPPEVFV